ncbi:hypothetical protein [Neptuniibacter sp. QD37_11]|uniref:hypothetical protein n=1 Tax=Neptuniibacter sp. QD37_11 TaxID=3398209 RepID=UPI0039F4745F
MAKKLINPDNQITYTRWEILRILESYSIDLVNKSLMQAVEECAIKALAELDSDTVDTTEFKILQAAVVDVRTNYTLNFSITRYANTPLIPEVGDLTDQGVITEVLEDYRIITDEHPQASLRADSLILVLDKSKPPAIFS